MSNNLKVLADNRDALLLAEVGAWLHDMGKCDEELLRESASDFAGPKVYKYKTAHSHLVASSPPLILLGESVSLRDLIEKSRPRLVRDTRQQWLIRVLGHSHRVAHTEKAEFYYLKKQTMADTRRSTPFGYESDHLTGLRSQLYTLPFNHLSDRSVFKSSLEGVFSKACGDTRRPLNDVTLWNWSNTVAAFYKAALAFALLIGKTVDPADLHWRLLSIRFNGIQFSENVSRISDLLAHQKLIEDGIRRVRALLEETYPLGTEVYSDENGSVFLVPDIDTLLDLKDRRGETLRNLIAEEFSAGTIDSKHSLRLNGEVLPKVVLSPTSWPQQLDPLPILPISEHMVEIHSNQTDSSNIDRWWQNYSEDVCTVCHLRPQGWSASDNKTHREYRARGKKCPPELACKACKSLERRVCSICEQRRESRSEQWWTKELNTTIWLDEIADTNGRLALVVGKYGLEPWLDGGVLFYPKEHGEAGEIQSPDNMIESGTPVRLFRVWETTHKFWQEITTRLKSCIDQVDIRLRIHGDFLPDSGNRDSLAVSHTYDLKLGNTNLSITCVAEGEYLTVDNLHRVAFLLGASKAEYEDETKAADHILDQLHDNRYDVEEPTGYGSPNKLLGRLHIRSVTTESIPYLPAITLLAEPRTFMTLAPANKALDVAKAIQEKYEKEICKVRNRLPLMVGIIFAGRRTPLPAILNAGWRMLKQPKENEAWIVRKVDPPPLSNFWPSEVELILEKNGQTMPIKVWTVMGNGTTGDVWYPYWCVEKDSNGSPPSGRTRQFVSEDGKVWVHVCDLLEGDEVHLLPSRFDFEFLDTSARRFEISYDNGKRRGSQRPARPYYLEQLDEFEALWNVLSRGLETTQIDNLIGIIEDKRMEWATDDNDEVFKQAVHDALNNANWKNKKRHHPGTKEFEQLYRAALSGQLADVVELYMHILKQQPEVDESQIKTDKMGENP